MCFNITFSSRNRKCSTERQAHSNICLIFTLLKADCKCLAETNAQKHKLNIYTSVASKIVSSERVYTNNYQTSVMSKTTFSESTSEVFSKFNGLSSKVFSGWVRNLRRLHSCPIHPERVDSSKVISIRLR